jgi:hypothetical protein
MTLYCVTSEKSSGLSLGVALGGVLMARLGWK